ncbi:MAG: FHA domain-containing protein [Gemmatimonadota bacterium]|jgi:pSer/pThr/pTyr-binding forkhead associated (FHA) protein
MPKLTLLLGRKTMRIYDLDKETIHIGRDEGMDIFIDNPSVSRRHAEIRREGQGWVVEDLGSSNGTFLHGARIASPRPLAVGDEIGFGKFSVLFDKAVAAQPDVAREARARVVTPADTSGTMHIKAHEVKELLKDSERKRRAHLQWESGGRKGAHYLSEAPAILVGTDDLCDLQVPRGPRHHLLVLNTEDGCEVRNLAMFARMTVRGRPTRTATLEDGDVVEMSGVKLTFVADIA